MDSNNADENTETVEPNSSVTAVKAKRNAKRSRLTSLIRERAAKKKNLASVLTTVLSQEKSNSETNNEDHTKINRTIPLPLSDPRHNFAKTMLDAINSGDVQVLETVFRENCTSDVVSWHIYNGKEEQNPLGPNSTIIVGLEDVIKVWCQWFTIAPDSIFKSTYYASFLDPKTGIATSTSGYKCKFTRILTDSGGMQYPAVSREVIQQVERLKYRMLTGQILTEGDKNVNVHNTPLNVITTQASAPQTAMKQESNTHNKNGNINSIALVVDLREPVHKQLKTQSVPLPQDNNHHNHNQLTQQNNNHAETQHHYNNTSNAVTQIDNELQDDSIFDSFLENLQNCSENDHNNHNIALPLDGILTYDGECYDRERNNRSNAYDEHPLEDVLEYYETDCLSSPESYHSGGDLQDCDEFDTLDTSSTTVLHSASMSVLSSNTHHATNNIDINKNGTSTDHNSTSQINAATKNITTTTTTTTNTDTIAANTNTTSNSLQKHNISQSVGNAASNCTYHGVFSVEVTPECKVTKMHFAFTVLMG